MSSGVKKEEEDTREVKTITGKITKIAQAVLEGTSHYYLTVEGSDDIFDLSVVDFLDVVRCEVGQEITMEYKEDEKANTVMSLTIDGVTQGKSEEEAKAADPTEVIPLEDEAKEVTE